MTSPKTTSRHGRKVSGRKRDYRLEYQRRLAKGLSTGLSRSQARGHARAGERPKPLGPIPVSPNTPEERAIKLMKSGSSLRSAARIEGLREERLRRYLKENTDAKREGRKWLIVDERPRRFPFYSRGKLVSPILDTARTSRAAVYMHAVREFLPTGNADLLSSFAHSGVRDVAGKFYPFEIEENTLYELDNAGELSFPEFYRIIT